MRSSLRHACVTLAIAASSALLVAGCGADDWSEPHAEPSAVGTLSTRFTPDGPPAPEATITPEPGSWDRVGPSKDYRVVLLSAGTEKETQILVDAVRSWAEAEGASLKTVAADVPSEYTEDIDRAIALKPDLVITAGNDLVDPLATVTPHFLDQKFLVIGAELPEPTANVTAADWTGASFRGEGLGMSSSYDPESFTAERAGRAVRAGVAAVLSGLSGTVIWLS